MGDFSVVEEYKNSVTPCLKLKSPYVLDQRIVSFTSTDSMI